MVDYTAYSNLEVKPYVKIDTNNKVVLKSTKIIMSMR